MQKLISKKRETKRSKTKQSSKKNTNPSLARRALVLPFVRALLNVRERVRDLQRRRPHRSFRMTRRRDYVRSLRLPGYAAFTYQVFSTLWQQKGLFFGLIIVYMLAIAVVGGFVNQSSYIETRDIFNDIGGDVFSADWGALTKSGALLGNTLVESFSMTNLEPVQQLYVTVFGVLVWLTTVWLLRAILNGKRPRLRDGLYSGGAPIVASTAIVAILLIQLIPAGMCALVYSVLLSTNMLENGFILMLVHLLLIAVGSLTLYWVTSTIIALVVVTLPGMYPVQAMRTAGDLVIGRRIRILLRLLWGIFIIIGTVLIVAVPIILFDGWLKDTITWTKWLPIVPITIALLITTNTVWYSAYVYLLYRRIVDDDAKPA